jgi:hypothetical protein
MSHQKLIAALALVGLSALATGGSAIAGAGTAGHITVCYNAKTHTARYSGTGKCAPGIRAVVIGKGDVGPRGPHGTPGLDGDDGSNGSGGTNGNNGAVGAMGGAGPSGPTGSIGPDGPTGITGSSGATGSTGSGGAIGATGASGVNVFHMVVSAPTSVDGTVTAQCNSSEVVSGGGFSGAASRITRSTPTALGDGWSVTAVSPTSPVTATAICVAGTSS